MSVEVGGIILSKPFGAASNFRPDGKFDIIVKRADGTVRVWHTKRPPTTVRVYVGESITFVTEEPSATPVPVFDWSKWNDSTDVFDFVETVNMEKWVKKMTYTPTTFT